MNPGTKTPTPDNPSASNSGAALSVSLLDEVIDVMEESLATKDAVLRGDREISPRAVVIIDLIERAQARAGRTTPTTAATVTPPPPAANNTQEAL